MPRATDGYPAFSLTESRLTGGTSVQKVQLAIIAQLVEHHLAMVRVEGSSPFYRSRGLRRPAKQSASWRYA